MPLGIDRADEARWQRRLWVPTPAEIPSLVGWFDAEDPGSLPGGTGGLTKWTDKLSNGARSSNQSVTTARPQLDGQGGVAFTATQWFGDSITGFPGTWPTGSTPSTIVWSWWVAANTFQSDTFLLYGDGTGGGSRALNISSGRVQVQADGTGLIAPVGTYVGGYSLASWRLDSAGGNILNINGGVDLTYAGSAPATAASPSRCSVGAFMFPGGFVQPLRGSIFDILIFNTVLPTPLLRKVEGWMAWHDSPTVRFPLIGPYANLPPLIGD